MVGDVITFQIVVMHMPAGGDGLGDGAGERAAFDYRIANRQWPESQLVPQGQIGGQYQFLSAQQQALALADRLDQHRHIVLR